MYLAIHYQVLSTKYLRNISDPDEGKQPTCNNKFRLFKTNIEDVVHIITGCLNVSPRYYLPLRHDAIVIYLFQGYINKNIPRTTFKGNREYEFVYKVKECEYWWNILIKTIEKKYYKTNQMSRYGTRM